MGKDGKLSSLAKYYNSDKRKKTIAKMPILSICSYCFLHCVDLKYLIIKNP